MRTKKALAVWFVAVLVAVAGNEARSLHQDRKAAPGPRANYFPNLVLKTHQGKEVRFYDDVMKGDKIILMNFTYAQCNGICPGTTRNLVKVQQMLGDRVGKDIFMYTITLTPEQDTPEVLAEYVKSYQVGKGWTFLTGTTQQTELIRRLVGFVDPNPNLDKDKANHSGLVLVGNESIDRWMQCPGQGNPERIVDAIIWAESPNMKKTRRHVVERGGI